VGFFKWLYRLPGRLDRSFSTTAAAANAEGPGAGVNQLNVPAAGIVIQEIESEIATTGDGRESHDDDDPAA
jgi:hypothetical protein